MQKFNSTGSHSSSTLPRDAELQLRLADSGGSMEGRENGAGRHFLGQQQDQNTFWTKSKMLVGLDLICLCVGTGGGVELSREFIGSHGNLQSSWEKNVGIGMLKTRLCAGLLDVGHKQFTALGMKPSLDSMSQTSRFHQRLQYRMTETTCGQ